MFVVPTLGKLRQEDLNFEASLELHSEVKASLGLRLSLNK
jgi:hypothetical protein